MQRITIELYDHTQMDEVCDILADLNGIGLDDVKFERDGVEQLRDGRGELRVREEDGVTRYWITAPSQTDAADFARQFGTVSRSKWAGPGHYRSDVYIVDVEH